MNGHDLAARRSAAVAPAAYSVHPFYPARAEGSHVWDVDGKRYLDWSVGIAVMNVGHSHPDVLAAVAAQMRDFQHLCFAVGMHPSYVEVAEALGRIAPGPSPKKTFLVNSGAEAVENAVKIARVATGRPAIVAFTHAFHGRTQLALSLTGKAVPYKVGFAPRAAEIYRAPYPYVFRNPFGLHDEDAIADAYLEQLIDLVKTSIGEHEVAAFVLEPIAGEGGFIPAPGRYLAGLRAYADRIGALWIDDEVQTGVGRTGAWWAVDHFGLEPDLLCSAKALSSGFPLSAVVGKAEIMDKIAPGMLGSTFGGNPTGCAAALATLRVIERDGLLANARAIGDAIRAAARTWSEEVPGLADVRGAGAMIGLEFTREDGRTPDPDVVHRIVTSAREAGLIILPSGTYGNVVRLLPPLTSTAGEVAEGIGLLRGAILSATNDVAAVA